MQEAFLHFIWKYQYFEKTDLTTTNKQTLNITKPGFLNSNSGPDFSEARINIDSINWSGSVEIHIKSSDWYAHQHQKDGAYDHVILHVVWQHDKEVMRSDGSVIPTLALQNITDYTLYSDYLKLIKNPSDIPCENGICNVSDITVLGMLDRVVSERLLQKSAHARELYQKNNQNWEETTYQLITQNFGFKINKEPFSTLAKSLPFKVLLKHRDSLLQLEALLFGQAGFLEGTVTDGYHIQLQKEFKYLKHKYALATDLNSFRWKFSKLRPANFPTIRIAQLAMLIHREDRLFSKLIESNNIKQLSDIFSNAQSVYWREHYVFGKKTDKEITGLGESSIYGLLINTVIPLLVAYSKQMDDEEYMSKALDLLQQLPKEENNIIRKWKKTGIKTNSAFDSQGLIQLYNNYCVKRRCLNCQIGVTLVRKA